MARMKKRTKAYPDEEKQVVSYKSKKRQKMVMYRALRAPVPYKLTTKLKYTTGVTLVGGNNRLAGVHVYSANGVYDPDISGIGHQPRGFDQLMALYDHMVVIYAEINTMFWANDDTPVVAWIAARDFTTAGATMDDYNELSNCKRIQVSRQNLGFSNQIWMKINPNKYLSRTSPLSDPNLKNSSVSNPVEQVYWHVGVSSPTATVPAGTTSETQLTYTVVCIEPKDPGIS